jgi:hypothetical protein
MEWVASLSPRSSGGDGAQPERIGCTVLAVIGKVPDLSRISAALNGCHGGSGRAGHGLGSLLSTHTVQHIPPKIHKISG